LPFFPSPPLFRSSAAGPIGLGAFQRARHYRAVEHRYKRMAEAADLAVVFADFGDAHESRLQDREPVEVGIATDDPLGHEWAVVVDAPGFSVCLVAWEPPVSSPPAEDLDRVFEVHWTMDPEAVRTASRAGAVIAQTAAPSVGDRIDELLADRPLGAEAGVEALEALTLRMVGYLEGA
jgi:DICT domain-containing protein